MADVENEPVTEPAPVAATSASISVSQGPTYPPGHPLFEGGKSDANAQTDDEDRGAESSPGINSSEPSETPKKTQRIPRR